jgi:hypothetical protein
MNEEEARARLADVETYARQARASIWTISELAVASGIKPATLRWHCRQGLLAGKAIAKRNIWLIPRDVAIEFIRIYRPWASPDETEIGDDDE